MTTQAPGAQTGVSAEQIADQIEKKARVTVTTRLTQVSWFPRRSALEVQQALLIAPADDHKALYDSLKPTLFQAGKVCPVGNAGLKSPRVIFEMFENDVEIRVYTLGQDSAPALLRLSKSSPMFTVREFMLSTFIDEMADEWSEVVDEMSTAEKEREAVIDYAESVGPLYSMQDFLQDVRDEVHLQEVEDDEEEEDDAPEVPQAKLPPVPLGPASAQAATLVSKETA